jgi:hypothetical protein
MTGEGEQGGVEATALPNYVDYVQDLVGFELSPDNAKAVAGRSRSELAEMRERNLRIGLDAFTARVGTDLQKRGIDEVLPLWEGAPTPYERVPGVRGEYRPLLHGRIHQAADVFGGDAGYVFGEGDPEVRIAALKRYLLYAHRIVLADPLFYVNQYFGSDLDDLREQGRRALAGFLDFLYAIQPLVRNGIVSFYPQYEHGMITDPLQLFKDRDYDRWVRVGEGDAKEILLLEAGQPLVSELLFYCERFEADCCFDRADFERILAAMTRYGGELADRHAAVARDRVLGEERAALATLGVVSLPALDRLSIGDVVAVRAQAEGFDLWRDALGEGLRRIEGTADPETVKEAVAESLVRGGRAVDRQVKTSGLLETAKGPAQTLAIGALAGLTVGGPIGAVAGSGVSAVLTTLVKYAGGRADRHAAKALAAHYSVWEAEPGSGR